MDSKQAQAIIDGQQARGNINIIVALELKHFIQQQDKMIELAIDKLENGCCDAPESFDCDEVGMVCRDCWRKYLQSEVEK